MGAAGRSAGNRRRAALSPFQPLRAPAGGAARGWEVSPGLVLDAAVRLGCRAATGAPPRPARLGRPLLPEQGRCPEKSAAGDAISGPTLVGRIRANHHPGAALKAAGCNCFWWERGSAGRSHFLGGCAIISSRGIITMLRILVILPPDFPTLLTLGSFLGFPWRAGKGQYKVVQKVCLRCPLKWGLVLALSLTCSVISRKRYSPRFHSSHLKKCREGIKTDHIKDW